MLFGPAFSSHCTFAYKAGNSLVPEAWFKLISVTITVIAHGYSRLLWEVAVFFGIWFLHCYWGNHRGEPFVAPHPCRKAPFHGSWFRCCTFAVRQQSPEGCARHTTEICCKVFPCFQSCNIQTESGWIFSVPFQVAFSIVSAEVGT